MIKSESKIRSFEEMAGIVADFKSQGKKVVQINGVFDIIHPGIIQHIESAKKMGDLLVVSVVGNENVNRGPGRPIFDVQLRMENVAAIASVDYVCSVNDQTPFEHIKKIKPDIFAIGRDDNDRNQVAMGKISREMDEIRAANCKVHITKGVVSNSTTLINQFLGIYPEETRRYLRNFSEKYSAGEIINHLDSFHDLKTLVIGEGIIDEYYYCDAMGKSAKDPLVVNRYLHDESFAGGAFAIANHLAGLCNQVELVTVLGKKDSKEEFILKKLKSNISPRFFYRDESPTIVKRRYLNKYLNQKMFEVCYMNDDDIPMEIEKQICQFLDSEIVKYDLVVLCDFGHGIFNRRLIEFIEKRAKILAVNVQTNGANVGFNFVTKYQNINFACLDAREARLSCHDRYGSINDISKKISQRINSEYLIITQGNLGSIGYSSEDGFNHTPALATKVVDRIGAGDAFFAVAAPCFAMKLPLDMVSFIGNAAGALAVQIVANREPVGSEDLCNFIQTLLEK